MSSAAMDQKVKGLHEIEDLIGKAIKKVGAKKEKDLCRYLPVAGAYMHHFTLRKMKAKQPQQLRSLIESHIINPEKPTPLPAKRRAPRGTRKKLNPSFSIAQITRLAELARQAGDKEMSALLSPKKPFTMVKKELIASIRHGKIDQALWNIYVEVASSSLLSQ